MIVKTEAVVLRGMEYGETSQIVTLFTRERGKISTLARGARLPKSRFGSTLQPMSYTQVVFYHKPSRSLQTLSESAHVHPFQRIGRDLERISVGLRVVELVNALLQEEEANPMVFNLVLQVLHRLDEAENRIGNLLPYFQLRISTVLGFAPSIDRDRVQSLPAEGGMLLLDTGTVVEAGAVPAMGRYASRAALRAFAIFARAALDDVMRMRLEPEAQLEVGDLVEAYLRYHFGDSYPSRGGRIIGQLTGDAT